MKVTVCTCKADGSEGMDFLLRLEAKYFNLQEIIKTAFRVDIYFLNIGQNLFLIIIESLPRSSRDF